MFKNRKYIYCFSLLKLHVIMYKSRDLHCTLTEVIGHKRVHRVSLSTSKSGDVETIHCHPCGPLVYTSDLSSDDESETPVENGTVQEEQHYTRVKVI